MEAAGPSGPSSAQSEQSLVVAATAEASGIVPQLQNIVATVNLGVKLDLKSVALHARNAEYNPKVLSMLFVRATQCTRHVQPAKNSCEMLACLCLIPLPCAAEVLCCHYAYPRPKDHSPDLRVR